MRDSGTGTLKQFGPCRVAVLMFAAAAVVLSSLSVGSQLAFAWSVRELRSLSGSWSPQDGELNGVLSGRQAGVIDQLWAGYRQDKNGVDQGLLPLLAGVAPPWAAGVVRLRDAACARRMARVLRTQGVSWEEYMWIRWITALSGDAGIRRVVEFQREVREQAPSFATESQFTLAYVQISSDVAARNRVQLARVFTAVAECGPDAWLREQRIMKAVGGVFDHGLRPVAGTRSNDGP